MKYVLVYLFVLVSLTNLIGQNRCGTDEYNQLQRLKFLNNVVKTKVNENLRTENGDSIAGIITIPVVFHVIHNTADNSIGGDGNLNISDEQIQSQIVVMNEDYRRMYGTNGYNTNPVGADVEVEFCLAKTDPNCLPTKGITRHYTSNPAFDVFGDDSLIKSFGDWSNTDYLNIWVCSLVGGYLGYTQFPNQSNLPGLSDFHGNSNTDGIIVNYKEVGRGIGTSKTGIYDLGRTLTHEAGHWMGLIHTWGDAFCGDDYCEDTPPAEDHNLASNCDPVYSKCDPSNPIPTRNMIENYLDYSPDKCMNIFTQDQKSRMRSVFVNSPDRIKILSSKGCSQTYHDSLPVKKTFDAGTISDSGWTIGGNIQNVGIFNVGSYGSSAKSIYLNNSIGNSQVASPLINFSSSSNPVFLFDMAIPKVGLNNTITIQANTGCKTGNVFIKQYLGKDLTSSNTLPTFGIDSLSWSTYLVPLKDLIPYGFASIIIESNSNLNAEVHLDNLRIIEWGNNPILNFPNLVKLISSASFNSNIGKIQIEPLYNGYANVNIAIYDITGKEVHSESINNSVSKVIFIDSNTFMPGMYIIKVLVNNQLSVNKVVVF